MTSQVRPLWTVISILVRLVLFADVVDPKEVSEVLSCKTGWTLQGAHCIKVYNRKLTWDAADDVCRLNGAVLSQVYDLQTNSELSASATSLFLSSYWIGLHRTSASNVEWSDGSNWVINQGFWSNNQPDINTGDCVYVSKTEGHFLWSFGRCGEKRGFICQYEACDNESFKCISGECISSDRVCDGQADCIDDSDEIHCGSLCQTYVEGTTGSITSANHPNPYNANSRCRWTIEGPIGSVIQLEFTTFETEPDVDEVLVLSGGKTEGSSVAVARFSGSMNGTSFTCDSINNFMIIKFTSDNRQQLNGFRAIWNAVQTPYPDSGLLLVAESFSQSRSSFTYPASYLVNQEIVYIISARQDREIVHLELVDLDLAEGDLILLRDGPDASSPLLASLRGAAQEKRHFFSTGQDLYIFFKTAPRLENKNRGFDFLYKTGCTITLSGDSGEIASPGYPYVNYANLQDCSWTIDTQSGEGITLHWENFEIHPSDTLKAYAGIDEQSQALHPGQGFSPLQVPNDISVEDGKLHIVFETSAILNARGFHATYSVGCPDPNFNGDTLVQPSLNSYKYGISLTITCGSGYVFDSKEFYVDTIQGMESQSQVTMECLFGGIWSVKTTPKCIRKYCGLPPSIINGYIKQATGAVYGSRVTYGCGNGYVLSDSSTLECNSAGSWGTPPSCVALLCPALDLQSSIALPTLTVNDGRSAGSIYNFACPAGYGLSGSPVLLCQADGSWTDGVPACQRRPCVVPNISSAVVKTNALTVLYGSQLEVECSAGYVVAGTQVARTTITCQDDQTFGSLPLCEVSSFDYCANTPCSVNQTCVSVIGTYRCSCKDGYKLEGNLCLDVNECEERTDNCGQICVNLEATYECSCQSGFSLYKFDGMNGYTIPSGETGLEAGDVFHINHTCVLNQCPDPGNVDNGYITNPQTSYNVNDTLTIDCQLGFVPSGSVVDAVCSEDGVWLPGVPSCTVATCPPDNNPSVVNPPYLILPPVAVNFGEEVTLFCNVAGQISYNKTRTCVYDPKSLTYKLQGDSYECGVIDCGQPEIYLPKGAQVPPGLSTTFGTTFLFECEFPYFQSGGNIGSVITCDADGSWNLGDLDCTYGVCPDPGSPPDGSTNIQGYGYRNLTTYSCSRIGYNPFPSTPLLCEQNDVGTALRWNASTPACVDTERPVFINCPSSSISVLRYSSALVATPLAFDNSGMWAELNVIPPYFLFEQPIADDMNVTFTVVDHAGNKDICEVNVLVLDETSPTISCPSPVILTVSEDSNVTYTFSDQLITASDNKGIVATVFSIPSLTVTYDDVRTTFTITATVQDAAANSASCSFQVYVSEEKCSANNFLTAQNVVKSCTQKLNGGYECRFTCAQGFYFYESQVNEEFVSSCDPGQEFSPTYIPSCAESVPQGKVSQVTLLYGPLGAGNEECRENYESKIGTELTNLRAELTTVCAALGSIENVQLKSGSLSSRIAASFLFVLFKLEILPSSAPDGQTSTCFTNLDLDIQGMTNSTGALAELGLITIEGCPNITIVSTQTTELDECENDLGTRTVETEQVCLKCPPGTSRNDLGGCDLCPIGTYWVESIDPFLGECALCPPGTSTEMSGTAGPEFCTGICFDNFVSESGVPPCTECSGNTYRYNETYCKECPVNTLAMRHENPLASNCSDICTYTWQEQRILLSEARASYSVSIETCENICEKWDIVNPRSQCVGFNYNSQNSFCIIYDRPGILSFRTDYDFYDRNCGNDNLEDCYCAQQCPKGSYSETGHEPNCQPCPAGYTSNAGDIRCTECASNETSEQGVGNCFDAADIFCSPDPCFNGGVCRVENHDFYCECPIGTRGRRCEQVINACLSTPCYYGGGCVPVTGGNFQCSCPDGTTGERCETNIDDCTALSCNDRGTCLDGFNSFTCLCVDGFSGERCETRLELACEKLACDLMGTELCVASNDVYAKCVCKPGYTGPTCFDFIDLCLSEPCQNSGLCFGGINSYKCQCLPGFKGENCELPEFTCNDQSCVNSDSCEEDYRTGLPTCVCSSGYTLGSDCSFVITEGFRFEGEVNDERNATVRTCQLVCDFQGNLCKGFTYVPIPEFIAGLRGVCKFYSRIDTKVLDSSPGLLAAEKSCTSYTGPSYYSPWINPTYIQDEVDIELVDAPFLFDEIICQTTTPLNAECRSDQKDQNLPAQVYCGPDGIFCNSSQDFNCSQLEIRFLCSRSRVFQNQLCELKDICTDLQPCVNGNCIADVSQPSLYRCECDLGYEGANCQREVNECQVPSNPSPCLNGGTCVDEFRGFSCLCAPGFTGLQCASNVDDCETPQCDLVGTDICVDGINNYTCNCKPGYTGQLCESNIDECLAQPCLHQGNCTDLINGFSCDCVSGWTGQQCETLVDYCTAPSSGPCGGGSSCFSLFEDFYCNCSLPTFGKTCENSEDICTNANPCVNSAQCQDNGQTCNCVPGTIADGCHLYDFYTCQDFQCENGGTCDVQVPSLPVCLCSSEYTGSRCELHIDNCQQQTCQASAVCVDGIGEAFCRCPIGLTGPTCSESLPVDFDLCLNPAMDSMGGRLPYPAPYNDTGGFTIKLWVKYTRPGSKGTFLSLFYAGYGYSGEDQTLVLSMNDEGLNLPMSQTMPYTYKPINDGNWHYLVITWDKATGHIDLVVDFVRHGERNGYAQGLVLAGGGFEPIIGSTDQQTDAVFIGCVSGLDMLNKGLDFDTEVALVDTNPGDYLGNVFRWGEFEPYGNAVIYQPSTATTVECPIGTLSPDCSIPRDVTAPEVLFCPESISVATIYNKTQVSWVEPSFNGAVSISSTTQPGTYFALGNHKVVYTAKDEAGNTALCVFTVYVNTEICPVLDPPRVVGADACQNVPGFSSCTISCPAPSFTLVDETPNYITCGPGGDWHSLQSWDGLYPTCGGVLNAAKTKVELGIKYNIDVTNCNSISTAIESKTREELSQLRQTWGDSLCSVSTCSDINLTVDCSQLPATSLNITIPNADAVLTNGATSLTVEEVFLSAILDDSVLGFTDIFPSAVLDRNGVDIIVTSVCPAGQVVRGGQCVSCGPGSYYIATSEECMNCAVGEYQDDYGQLNCNECPQGQTTSRVGSESRTLCLDSCPVGQYYNEAESACQDCLVGFYQDTEGQFQCKPCPVGQTTSQNGSTSISSCSAGCGSGEQLLGSGLCQLCPLGTYRDSTLNTVCVVCPDGFTTPGLGSVSQANCSVLKCPSGSRANATLSICTPCPQGEYQPLINQVDCLPCSDGFTTASTGSRVSNDCQRFCPSGQEIDGVNCVDCPIAFYKDNADGALGMCQPCPPGYLTVSTGSEKAADCSRRNCSAGFKIVSVGVGIQEQCVACPLGTYQPQPYQYDCEDCPAQTYTRATGATDVSQCEDYCESGFERQNNSCQACPRGYYKDNSVDRFSQCLLCPGGTFITPSEVSTSQGECSIRNCSAGYFINALNQCQGCPIGQYQPDKWQTSCLSCPIDTTTRNLGSTSDSECYLSCPAGKEDVNGSCQDCQVGYYKDIVGVDSCTACPSEFITAVAGAKSRTFCNIRACDAGSYRNAGTNACLPCPYGQYQPAVWQESCLNCPTGLTTLVTGAQDTTSCILDCAAGLEYSAATNSCITCPQGYYRDKALPSQISCVLCPSDFITSGLGADALSDCNIRNCSTPGEYRDTQTNECELCPTGTYNSEKWRDECTSCPDSFTTKSTGRLTVDECYRDCPSGQQVNEATNTCVDCGLGSYRNSSLRWTCQPCPPDLTTTGTQSSSLEACSVSTCPAGSYYNSSTTQCQVCPIGFYQSQANQKACISCPQYRFTLQTGSKRSADCLTTCTANQDNCSSFATCTDTNTGGFTCTCRENYAGDGIECTHVCDLSEPYCLNGGACLKTSQLCVCTEYYEGPRCQTRRDAEELSDNETEILVGSCIGGIAFLLLLILLAICAFKRMKRVPEDKDSVDGSTFYGSSLGRSRSSALITRANTKMYPPLDYSNSSMDPAIYLPRVTSQADTSQSFYLYDNTYKP